MNIKQIKQRALQNIDHSVFSKIALNIIGYSIIVAILNSLAGATLIGSIIISGPLVYGLHRISVRISKGDRDVTVNNLFDGFKECFAEALILNFMISLYVALWSLLLIIPGIVKSYSYSLAFYIQQDSEDKSWKYCLNKSRELMNGYKMSAFMLDLSFIGWYLLGTICCGIGVFFVTPYHLQAKTNFYHEVLAKHNVHAEVEPQVVEA